MKDRKEFWAKKHEKYSAQDWIDRPSIFAEQILEYLPKDGKLLDLAAGQGQDARFFAKAGFEVTCTDFSEEVLDRARKKAEIENLSISYWLVDLANELPFIDGEFDVVYSHLGLHFFNKKKTCKLFKEIHRVLKPGGVLVTLLNTIEDPEIKVGRMQKVEDNYYESQSGMGKSYFSVDYVKELIGDLFESLLVDDKGETYKDEHKNLIRLVGKRF